VSAVLLPRILLRQPEHLHQANQAAYRAAVGPAYKDSGLVFTHPDGSPIHPHLFSEWFKRHVRVVGLPSIRLHDLRHSYATAALAAGIPAKVVSERLGHAPSPSRWTPTATSCRAWTSEPPRPWRG
jgi:integrase